MRVLMVVGSPHKEGCVYTALCEVASALNAEGIDTDFFWIGNKPIGGCIGCHGCAKKHRCVFDDKVNEFLSIAGDYDGFVFGTPVHWASAAGAMSAFLDRVFYADFCGGLNSFLLKPAAAVVTARRAGTTATWDQINKYFGLMQMPIITSRYWNMAFGANPEELKKDMKGMQIMRILGKNMAWFLKCKQAGEKAGIALPEQEKIDFTNFIRNDL